MRQKQYENYLEQLFDYDESNKYIIKLGDEIGKTIFMEKSRQLEKKYASIFGAVPVISGGKKSPYNHNVYIHSIPCITISESGAYAGYIWYHDYPIYASKCFVIYSDKHLTKYLYYMLKNQQSKIYNLQSGSAQPHIYAKDLKKLRIYLPPLEEQKRIVAILDKFETLSSSLSESLPREIALRQKQYEYYLNLLFSFPNSEDNAA